MKIRGFSLHSTLAYLVFKNHSFFKKLWSDICNVKCAIRPFSGEQFSGIKSLLGASSHRRRPSPRPHASREAETPRTQQLRGLSPHPPAAPPLPSASANLTALGISRKWNYTALPFRGQLISLGIVSLRCWHASECPFSLRLSNTALWVQAAFRSRVRLPTGVGCAWPRLS